MSNTKNINYTKKYYMEMYEDVKSPHFQIPVSTYFNMHWRLWTIGALFSCFKLSSVNPKDNYLINKFFLICSLNCSVISNYSFSQDSPTRRWRKTKLAHKEVFLNTGRMGIFSLQFIGQWLISSNYRPVTPN